MIIKPSAIDYEVNRPQYDQLIVELNRAGFAVQIDADTGHKRRHAVAVHLRAAGNAYGIAVQVAKHVTQNLRGQREGAHEREHVPIYDDRGLLLQTVRLA